MTDGPVRVDTHLVINVLYGLCRAGKTDPKAAERNRQRNREHAWCDGATPREADAVARATLPTLTFGPVAGEPRSVQVRFAGRHGGVGRVVIPDQAPLRATLSWLASHRDGEPYLRAVLGAVRAQQDDDSPWHHERAVELLWGPRNQKHSRARQAPPVRRLVELLLVARFELDAPVSAPPTPQAPSSTNNNKRRRRRDDDRDRARAAYGGRFDGTLVVEDPDTKAVGLHPQLRQLLDKGPYDMRPRSVFMLRIPGHHNAKGNQWSRAARCTIRHGVLDFVRFRRKEALERDGAVQAIAVEDLLTRFTSVPVDRRRMAMFVEGIEDDIKSGALGDVTLPEPIVRRRQPGRCELRLSIPTDRPPHPVRREDRGDQPSAAGGGSRRPAPDRRPLAAATASGEASSTGPPTR